MFFHTHRLCFIAEVSWLSGEPPSSDEPPDNPDVSRKEQMLGFKFMSNDEDLRWWTTSLVVTNLCTFKYGILDFLASPKFILFKDLVEWFSPASTFDTDVALVGNLPGPRMRPRTYSLLMLWLCINLSHWKDVRTLCRWKYHKRRLYNHQVISLNLICLIVFTDGHTFYLSMPLPVRLCDEPFVPDCWSLEAGFLELSSPELQYSLPRRLSTSVSENASEVTEQSSPIVEPGGDGSSCEVSWS